MLWEAVAEALRHPTPHPVSNPTHQLRSVRRAVCCCAPAGETARRRDPRTHPYCAMMCPLAKMVSERCTSRS
eukprot:357117-Chlamydomonas_euryale.AAC.2